MQEQEHEVENQKENERVSPHIIKLLHLVIAASLIQGAVGILLQLLHLFWLVSTVGSIMMSCGLFSLFLFLLIRVLAVAEGKQFFKGMALLSSLVGSAYALIGCLIMAAYLNLGLGTNFLLWGISSVLVGWQVIILVKAILIALTVER